MSDPGFHRQSHPIFWNAKAVHLVAFEREVTFRQVWLVKSKVVDRGMGFAFMGGKNLRTEKFRGAPRLAEIP